MPPEAIELDPQEASKVRQHRRAFRRVFMPVAGERATDEDRVIVMDELSVFCCLEAPFKVELAGSDPGLQLAVQEGRRTVLLYIREAIRRSYAEQRLEEPEPTTATTE